MSTSANTSTKAGCSAFNSSVLFKYGFSHEWRIDAKCYRPNSVISLMGDVIGTLNVEQENTVKRPIAQAGPPRTGGFIENNRFLYKVGTTANIIDPNSNFTMLGFMDTTTAAGENITPSISLGSGDIATYEVGYSKTSTLAIFRRVDSASVLVEIIPPTPSGKLLLIGSVTGSNLIFSVNGGSFSAPTAVSNLTLGIGATKGNLGFTAQTHEGYHWGLKQGLITNADAANIYSELLLIHSN